MILGREHYALVSRENTPNTRRKEPLPERFGRGSIHYTPAYCRIEKGERRAKREQVITLASYLNEDKEELLTLWLADQVSVVLATDRKIAKRVLTLAKQSING